MNSDEERSEAQTDGSQTGSKEPSQPADSEVDERVCGGRLLDITKAPQFLQNESWCEQADYVNKLREAWDNWTGPPDDGG